MQLKCPKCGGKVFQEPGALTCLMCGWERITSDKALHGAQSNWMRSPAPMDQSLSAWGRWRAASDYYGAGEEPNAEDQATN